MQPIYVDFRLHKYARYYLQQIKSEIETNLHIQKTCTRSRPPHMTLYGSSETNNIKAVVSEIKKVSQKYTLVPFHIKGFAYFDTPRGKVVYLDIAPSPELVELRKELFQRLRKLCPPTEWDEKAVFGFHATIAEGLNDYEFNRVWSYLQRKESPDIPQQLLRITVLGKGSKIISEYDLILQKELNRQQALSGYWWRKTIQKLRILQALPEIPAKRQSILDRIRMSIKRPFIKKSIYLMGDTHKDR